MCSQELSGQKSGKSFNDVKALTANGKPKELFFSSDLCAIVEHTKNYLAIEDNEIVHIKVQLKCSLVSMHPIIVLFPPFCYKCCSLDQRGFGNILLENMHYSCLPATML